MTDEEKAAVKPKEAQADESIDPNELSLLDGFFVVKAKRIDGKYEELKINRLSLRDKIKFQRFIASKGLDLKRKLESGKITDEEVLEYDLDVIDEFFRLLFGSEYTSKKSKLLDFDTLHLTEIAAKIMREEKLLGSPNEVIDTPPEEDDAENPTPD